MAIDRTRAERAVSELLAACGLDHERDPELRDTPARVARAWEEELLSGYGVDLSALLVEGSSALDEVGPRGPVLVSGIQVATTCPHHLLLALGHAKVAYLPGTRLLGLGTIARLVEVLSRRLTLQEQLGLDVVTALVTLGGARGGYCELELTHGCLCARGSGRGETRVKTVAAAGDFEDPSRWPILSDSRA